MRGPCYGNIICQHIVGNSEFIGDYEECIVMISADCGLCDGVDPGSLRVKNRMFDDNCN